MVSQVPVVGILMIVYGCLNAILGLALAVAGPAFIQFAMMNQPNNNNPGDKEVLTAMSIFYVGSGLLAVVCGILNIVGGARVLKYRGRTLAIVALFSNVSACLAGCWMMGIGVMIYGLIVFFNADVARAFRLAEEGVSTEDIKRRFDGRRYDRRDDDDDDDDDYDDHRDDYDRPPPRPDRDEGFRAEK